MSQILLPELTSLKSLGGGGGGGSISTDFDVDVSMIMSPSSFFSGAEIRSAKMNRWGRVTQLSITMRYSGSVPAYADMIEFNRSADMFPKICPVANIEFPMRVAGLSASYTMTPSTIPYGELNQYGIDTASVSGTMNSGWFYVYVVFINSYEGA